MRRSAVLAGACMALALTACGAAENATKNVAQKIKPTATPASQTRLGKSADSCTALRFIEDAGGSLHMDTQGEEELSSGGPYALFEQITCVLTVVKAPDYVLTHIQQTSSLDGPQTDSWDGIEARWKYHPDSGLDLTLIDSAFKPAP